MKSLQQIASKIIERRPILSKYVEKAFNCILNDKMPTEIDMKRYKFILYYYPKELHHKTVAILNYHVTGDIIPMLDRYYYNEVAKKIELLCNEKIITCSKKHFYKLCELLGDSPYVNSRKKIFEINLNNTPIDPLIMEQIDNIKHNKLDKNIANDWNERERQLFLKHYHDIQYYGYRDKDILIRVSTGSYNGIIYKLNFPYYSHWIDDELIKAGIISKE